MRPFRQEFGVENKSVVAHAAFVEDFGIEDKETPEFGADFGKVDAPFYEIFIGRNDFIYIELVDATDEVGTADEDFPFVPSVSGKSFFGDVDKVFLCKFFFGVECVFFTGLPPDTSRKRDFFFLFRVVNTAFYTEHESLFHTQTHVIDSRLFRVGKFPFHFFVGDFLERRLLDLHFEDLTIVLVFDRQCLKLGCLYVEFGRCSAHAYKRSTLFD